MLELAKVYLNALQIVILLQIGGMPAVVRTHDNANSESNTKCDKNFDSLGSCVNDKCPGNYICDTVNYQCCVPEKSSVATPKTSQNQKTQQQAAASTTPTTQTTQVLPAPKNQQQINSSLTRGQTANFLDIQQPLQHPPLQLQQPPQRVQQQQQQTPKQQQPAQIRVAHLNPPNFNGYDFTSPYTLNSNWITDKPTSTDKSTTFA